MKRSSLVNLLTFTAIASVIGFVVLALADGDRFDPAVVERQLIEIRLRNTELSHELLADKRISSSNQREVSASAERLRLASQRLQEQIDQSHGFPRDLLSNCRLVLGNVDEMLAAVEHIRSEQIVLNNALTTLPKLLADISVEPSQQQQFDTMHKAILQSLSLLGSDQSALAIELLERSAGDLDALAREAQDSGGRELRMAEAQLRKVVANKRFVDSDLNTALAVAKDGAVRLAIRAASDERLARVQAKHQLTVMLTLAAASLLAFVSSGLWQFWAQAEQLGLANEILVQRTAEAEQASQAKSQFLACMSHELRTPLNGVIGMTELLQNTKLNEKQQQFVEACRTSGESLLHLINDILDFSKIEAGKLELDEHAFELELLVTDTLEALVWRAAEKSLDIPCYIEPAVCLKIHGDSNRLRQVLVNLIGNAIKFTDTGEVKLSVDLISEESQHATIRFTISDSGIGIPKDKLQLLFKSFSQIDASTTRHYGGTGLGLAISRSLVDLMGGRMGVESDVGAGSTFWFELPLQVIGPTAATACGVTGLTDRRVLIVDPNSASRKILHDYATEWRMDAEVADSAMAALNCIQQARNAGRPFQLVLSSNQKLGEDGQRLVKALNGSDESVVLLQYALDSQTDVELHLQEGVAAILRRPLRRMEMHDVLCRVLSRAQRSLQPATQFDSRDYYEDSALQLLLVEDNKINQLFMVELLKQIGYSCLAVDDGQQACQAVQQHAYDMVLMDCQMPVMDGFEATRQIRRMEEQGVLSGHVPIVAVTANAVKGDRERCLESGMDEYLSKPVQAHQVIEVMQRFCGLADSTAAEPTELVSIGEN